jgi:hypothetical protein
VCEIVYKLVVVRVTYDCVETRTEKYTFRNVTASEAYSNCVVLVTKFTDGSECSAKIKIIKTL